MSATDDDTELRDLLIQNLENSGVLNKLKVCRLPVKLSGQLCYARLVSARLNRKTAVIKAPV